MYRLNIGVGVVLAILRYRVLRFILPALAVLALSGYVQADGITPRIMPLGDSITRGYIGSVYRWGYRQPLYVGLTNAGYDFDFVGIKADGSFPDPQHEGRDGWQANEILNGRPSAPAEGKLADWLIADQPDVVLLHIGTNDISWNDVNFNDVNAILNVIDAYEIANNRHITVILALIINRRIDSPAVRRAQTTQFNIDVNNMAMNRIANGDDIIIVDMESALNYNIGVDMSDEVHPNDTGYGKMAAVWYNALAEYFDGFSISGYVLKADDSTPVAGMLIQAGQDINTVTDVNGFYELWLDYRWSGVVAPQDDGYIFEPDSYSYTNLNRDYVDMNYTATPKYYKIAGFVFEQDYVTPMIDVNVFADNGGGSILTDVDGYYELWVNYKWSGNITAGKYACAFEPESIYYEDVNRDYADQDYAGHRFDFRITGFVKTDCNVPVKDVLVDADNGSGQDLTEDDGFYEVWVDAGWSGTVMASKEQFAFEPVWMSYVDVQADIADQNYITNSIYDLDCDGLIGWGDFNIIAGNWLMSGPDIPGDFVVDETVNFLDFAEFKRVWQD